MRAQLGTMHGHLAEADAANAALVRRLDESAALHVCPARTGPVTPLHVAGREPSPTSCYLVGLRLIVQARPLQVAAGEAHTLHVQLDEARLHIAALVEEVETERRRAEAALVAREREAQEAHASLAESAAREGALMQALDAARADADERVVRLRGRTQWAVVACGPQWAPARAMPNRSRVRRNAGGPIGWTEWYKGSCGRRGVARAKRPAARPFARSCPAETAHSALLLPVCSPIPRSLCPYSPSFLYRYI